VHVIAQELEHGRTASGGRHVTHFQPRDVHELGERDVAHAVRPRARVGELTIFRLGVGDELLERLVRRIGVHDEYQRIGAGECDRLDLLEPVRRVDVLRLVLFDHEIEVRRRHEDVVAVRLLGRHVRRADGCGAARFVDDGGRLFGQLLDDRGKRLGGDLVHAAGRVRHDDRNRPGGVGFLGVDGGCGETENGSGQQALHGAFSSG
jgi:hypothetical protein